MIRCRRFGSVCLARSADQPQHDVLLVRPSQHRSTAKLFAVAGENDLRVAAACADIFEHAHELTTADVVRRNDSERLVRGIVHDREILDRTATCNPIED